MLVSYPPGRDIANIPLHRYNETLVEITFLHQGCLFPGMRREGRTGILNM